MFQASRCAASGGPLELPAVHFLCGHSFNARALGDNDRECPLCAPDFKRVMDIRRNMAAAAGQQVRGGAGAALGAGTYLWYICTRVR